MALLAVPNWSFGRNKDLLRAFGDTLDALPLRLSLACAGLVGIAAGMFAEMRRGAR